jgi:hypothetical protein
MSAGPVASLSSLYAAIFRDVTYVLLFVLNVMIGVMPPFSEFLQAAEQRHDLLSYLSCFQYLTAFTDG